MAEEAALINSIVLALALIPSGIMAFISLKNLNIKIGLDIQLKESAKTEMNINLVKTFTVLVDIATARGTPHLSEKAVEYILQNQEKGGYRIEDELWKAMIIPPVGAAAQDAAICAIYTFGKEYPILKDMAVKALEKLKKRKASTLKP